MNTQQTNQPEEKPSYYAVISAEVRYADIPPNAKLLYGEITALCNKEGYCWATNKYFADLYGVHKNTVSEWINILASRNFIISEVTPPTGKDVEVSRKLLIPLSKKTEGNNTYNNTSNSITLNKSNDVPSVPKVKEDKRDPQVQAVLDTFKKTFGHDPIDPKPRFIAKAFVSNLNKLASVKKDFDFNQTLSNVFRKYKAEFPDMSTRTLNTVRRHAKVYVEKTITYSLSNP